MGGEEEEEEGGFGIIFVVDCGEEYVYVVCGGVRVASRDEMVGGGWWGYRFFFSLFYNATSLSLGCRVCFFGYQVAAYGRLGLGRRMSADLAFGLLALW